MHRDTLLTDPVIDCALGDVQFLREFLFSNHGAPPAFPLPTSSNLFACLKRRSAMIVSLISALISQTHSFQQVKRGIPNRSVRRQSDASRSQLGQKMSSPVE